MWLTDTSKQPPRSTILSYIQNRRIPAEIYGHVQHGQLSGINRYVRDEDKDFESGSQARCTRCESHNDSQMEHSQEKHTPS